MDELIVLPEDNDLVAQLYSKGEEIPLPFEEDIFLMGIQVAGPTYNANIEELFDRLREGDRVRLVREPDNPYDEYAIRIDVIEDKDKEATAEDGKLTVDGGVKLGYFPRSHNRPFARLMDAGKYLYGVVRHKELIGEYPEIKVKIYMKDDVFRSTALPVQKEAPVPAPVKTAPQPVVTGAAVDFELEELPEGGYVIKKFRGIDEPKMTVPNDIGGKRIVGVGKAAYKGCLNVVRLRISEGIEFVENEAFYGCRNLTVVHLPETLTRIGSSVLEQSPANNAGAFEKTAIENIVLPKKLELLGACTFQHCTRLKSVTIPAGIATIADRCFWGCGSLFVVVMPKKLTKINRYAFFMCNNLKHVALPPTVRMIGASAFSGCYALSDLQLNDGLQTIEAYAFDDCPNLHDARIPRSVSKIEGGAFGTGSKKGITLWCYPGTAGLDYARENGFRIKAAE